MRKILFTLTFVSLAAAFISLPACGDDDDDSGASGSGGSSAAGSGGSAGSSAGSGGSAGSAGSAGGGDTTYCGKKEEELPPISKCDDPNASAQVKAFCGDTTSELKCKDRWEMCESDPACNKAISCFNQCSEAGMGDTAIGTCTPIAVKGGALSKALALQDCQKMFPGDGGAGAGGSAGGGGSDAGGSAGSN